MIDLHDPLLFEQIVEAVRQRDPHLVPGLVPCPARDLAGVLIEMVDVEAEHDHDDCSECEARDRDAYVDGQNNHPHHEDGCPECLEISKRAYNLGWAECLEKHGIRE